MSFAEGYAQGLQLKRQMEQMQLEHQKFGLEQQKETREAGAQEEQISIAKQQANTMEMYRKAFADALNAKSQEIDIPDDAAKELGLEPGTKIPTSQFGSYLRAYAAKTKAQKPTPAKLNYDQGIPVSVTGSDSTTYDVNDPNLPAELKPLVKSGLKAHSQHISEAADAQARTMANQIRLLQIRNDMPTTATRTMVEAAPKVIEFADRISNLVDQQTKQLGPLAGRWSEFMTGKVGAPNPEFMKLRTTTGLLQTLLMRMHVGARGGEYIMQHFHDLMDVGKQSPENLQASMGEIKSYAQELMKATGQQKAAALGGGGEPGNNAVKKTVKFSDLP